MEKYLRSYMFDLFLIQCWMRVASGLLNCWLSAVRGMTFLSLVYDSGDDDLDG